MESTSAVVLIALGFLLAIAIAGVVRYVITQNEKRLILEQQDRIRDLQQVGQDDRRRIEDLERRIADLEKRLTSSENKTEYWINKYNKLVALNAWKLTPAEKRALLSDTDKQPTVRGINVAKLRLVLGDRLSDDELKLLVYDLALDEPEGIHKIKAMKIVDDLDKRQRLGELLEWLKAQDRSDVLDSI